MPVLAVPRRSHRLLVACFIAGLVGRNDNDQPVRSEIFAWLGPDLVRSSLATWLGVSRAWFGHFYVWSD